MEHYHQKAWANMQQRCFNPNNRGFAKYGARGVKVCAEWVNDAKQFAKDIGPRPEGGRWGVLLKDGATEFNRDTAYWGEYLPMSFRSAIEVPMADVHEILRLIYVEGFSPVDIALGFPWSARRIWSIALGREYRVEGFPYPDTCLLAKNSTSQLV